jgi:hypothetical protein
VSIKTSVTTRLVSPAKLEEPQLRIHLQARDAFLAAGGSEAAPSATVLDEAGNVVEALFYKDNGVDPIARVRVGPGGKFQPVEWLKT